MKAHTDTRNPGGDERYRWLDEAGEPRTPEWQHKRTRSGGPAFQVDEFPEQSPNEKTRLNCLQGAKQVILPCFEIDEPDWDFGELESQVTPAEFLRTQRELLAAAHLRAMTAARLKERRGQVRKLSRAALRAQVRRKVTRSRNKASMQEFAAEVRRRKAEGYSDRQILHSLTPKVGRDRPVPASEVTIALKAHEVSLWEGS